MVDTEFEQQLREALLKPDRGSGVRYWHASVPHSFLEKMKIENGVVTDLNFPGVTWTEGLPFEFEKPEP